MTDPGASRGWDVYFSAPARRPRTTLLLTGIVVALSVLAVLRMRPNATLGAVFGKHDPAATALARVLNNFAAVDEILLLISDDRKDESPEQSAEALKEFG